MTTAHAAWSFDLIPGNIRQRKFVQLLLLNCYITVSNKLLTAFKGSLKKFNLTTSAF